MSDAPDEEAAPVERQWPFTLKLKCPVVFADETINELTFRRGKMGDLKGMKLRLEVSVDDQVTIASRLSGRQTQVIEALDGDDAGEVMSITLDFYGKFLKAGS